MSGILTRPVQLLVVRSSSTSQCKLKILAYLDVATLPSVEFNFFITCLFNDVAGGIGLDA